MSARVSFIMGRAGTGKTELILNKIMENEHTEKKSVLIVPDRATFATEKRLSSLLGSGILNTFIVSFTSLARRMIAEMGDERVFLSMQGRQMLLKRTIEEQSSHLGAFARVALHKGFTQECDEIILKCKRFGISPEELITASTDERLPIGLRDKLYDFAVIFERSAANTAYRYIDDEDLVNSLIQNIPASSYRKYDFFVDTPETLTDQSIRILAVLFANAPSVTISLRGDTAEFCRDRRLFVPDQELYHRIRKEAEAQGCAIDFTYLEGNKRTAERELVHLERELFAFPYNRFNGNVDTIELHTAGNRIQEVNACAEAIRQYVRKGGRYREIGIIVGDQEAYAPIIKRILPDYDIPFFMDAKRTLASHPISELIIASLACCQSSFRAQDFIRAIKSGLFPIDGAIIEKLENHILKYGLSGKRITEEFNHDIVEDEIEKARIAAITPIMHLKEAVSGRIGAKERIRAIYNFLEELQVGELLRQECKRLTQIGKLDSARQTAQIFDTVVEMLDQLYIVLGDDFHALKKFISVIEEGLKSYSIGNIPTTCDQVFVSNVDNSSVTEVEFLIVLGMNEGLIPKTKSDNAIINDSDLSKLKEVGLSVWSSTERMNRTEGLRVYSAFMRAKRKLRLSYSLSDSSGMPSTLFNRITKLFPGCKQTNGVIEPVTGSIERNQFELLTASLKHSIAAGTLDEPHMAERYAYFSAQPRYAEKLSKFNKAFFNKKDEHLDHESVLNLYGKHIVGTPTRLEIFNKCPFRYFMEYGMGVKERDEFNEKPNDRGSFIHAALEKLINGFIEDNVDFESITDDDISSRLKEILSVLAVEHNKGIYLSSAKMRSELRKLSESIAIAGYQLVRQITIGKFKPIKSEISFGRHGDLLPPLVITARNGVKFSVCGVVDRLDNYHGENKDYLRIIDYKSGQTYFNYQELASGIRLQLPLYAAAMEVGLSQERKYKLNNSIQFHAENRTGGFYYQYIGMQDGEISGLDEKEAEAVIKDLQKSFKLSGLTLNDAAVLRATDSGKGTWSSVVRGLSFTKGGEKGNLADEKELAYAIEFAKTTAGNTLEAITNGRVEVSPSICGNKRGCAYCKFGSICGFDRTAGDNYRKIRGVTADEFFNRE